ncbi:MAG: hypothetical protein ACRDS0_11215 [Pseudonocardiaceae bacterium]
MGDEWPHPELDASEVLRVLGRHEVDYVLIGGLALALYGSNQLTFDIDLVPAAERSNLDRLASAMRELRAKVIVYADPSEIHLSEPIWTAQIMLDNPFLHLRTRAGDVDLLLKPTGLPGGYDQLVGSSVEIRLHGLVILLAGLDDIATSKRTTGRPKDLQALGEIERLRGHSHRPDSGAPS